MKKVLFVCVAFAAGFLFSNQTSAQQVKIGYFDDQYVLSLIPGIQRVDTLLNSYATDSLKAEYDYTYIDYQRRDSMFKKDSSTLSAKAREFALRDLNNAKSKLLNWQQYQQQMLEAKQEALLLPYRQKILAALNEVIAEQKYTAVLRNDAVSPYFQIPLLDNLAVRVAIKMKLSLPKDVEDAWRQAGGTIPGAGTGAPSTPKPGATKPKG